METLIDRRLRIADLEVQLRCNRGELMDRLLDEFPGYTSRHDEPDIVVEYRAVDDFVATRPAIRPFPGYGCRATGDGTYVFWRRDSEGTLVLPALPEHAILLKFTGISLTYVIEAALRVAFSACLPLRGGLLLHSSGVVVDDKAFVFSGPSGAGKSTMARLLCEANGPLPALGDDLVALRPSSTSPTGWCAHATPFNGELGRAPETNAPLGDLYFLLKASRHFRRPLAQTDALRRILRNTMAYVDDTPAADRALAATSRLARRVRAHVLEFSLEPGISQVLGIT